MVSPCVVAALAAPLIAALLSACGSSASHHDAHDGHTGNDHVAGASDTPVISGQPAGFDADGLPVSVQLVGRAADEATLFRLGAQLEAARPWADARPPVG